MNKWDFSGATPSVQRWDRTPVGTNNEWRGEIARFVGLMAMRGSSPIARGTYLSRATGSDITAQLAARVSRSLATSDNPADESYFSSWLRDSILVSGNGDSIVGTGIMHYSALSLLNPNAGHSRYWSNFWYWALASELTNETTDNQIDPNTGMLLDKYLSRLFTSFGIDLESNEPSWSIPDISDFGMDVEAKLLIKALAKSSNESGDTLGNKDFSKGISGFKVNSRPSGKWNDFICPGSIVLLKRSIQLILNSESSTEDRIENTLDERTSDYTQDRIEDALAAHTSDYVLRSMFVLNSAMSGKNNLPESCVECRDKFAKGLIQPKHASESVASLENIEWIDTNCEYEGNFANAGPKESKAAKTLATIDLATLYSQLNSYTANRRAAQAAVDIVKNLKFTTKQSSESPIESISILWKLMSSERSLVVQSLRDISSAFIDSESPSEATRERLEGLMASSETHPQDLWSALVDAFRDVSTGTGHSLASRAREVMHSQLGGGALPTNQDPKGRLQRGGLGEFPKFHLATNDRFLSHMARTAFHEFFEQDRQLSLREFVQFVRERFKIELLPDSDFKHQAPGLCAKAAKENAANLSQRLKNMGILREFSDSSDWNRIVAR